MHIDIAGVMTNTKEVSYLTPGMSGQYATMIIAIQVYMITLLITSSHEYL
jgi:hypothetical protein